jgi:dynein heavy chain
VKDLSDRYAFFTEWVQTGAHMAFWLSAFTFPNAFTTALMQRYSRKAGSPSIDKLDFDFAPMNRALADFVEPAKDGAYVYGLFLEGAKWEEEKGHLTEPDVMELFVPMPVIHFKPIPKRTKALQNVYECPTYYYPIRKGSVSKDSFMFMIDLRLGEQPQEYWIKRGTALLMSLPS